MQPLSKRPFDQKALVLHRRHGLPIRPHQECAIHSRPHTMQPLARCVNHTCPFESRSVSRNSKPVELPIIWRACRRADPHIVHGRACVKRRDKTLRRHSVVVHVQSGHRDPLIPTPCEFFVRQHKCHAALQLEALLEPPRPRRGAVASLGPVHAQRRFLVQPDPERPKQPQ